jgi:predicted acyltransferase
MLKLVIVYITGKFGLKWAFWTLSIILVSTGCNNLELYALQKLATLTNIKETT